MRRTKVEPPTAGQGPAGATRKRALPAAPPAEASDEQQLSAKQARRLKDHYTRYAHAHIPRERSLAAVRKHGILCAWTAAPNPAPTNRPIMMLMLSAKQARALAALQIKMTPVVKSSAPPARADAREPAPALPSKRASLSAAAPAAASLHLLTAAAAAESRDAAMDSDEEREVCDRGEPATMVTPLLLQPHVLTYSSCNPTSQAATSRVQFLRCRPDAAPGLPR